MSENPTSDKPSGAPNTRRPLEETLDQASQQAQELSEQVGIDAGTSSDIDLTPKPEVAAHNSLDAHFDEIEALLNTTADEIGQPETEPAEDDDPQDAAPSPPVEPGPAPVDEGEPNEIDWPEEAPQNLDDQILRSVEEIPDEYTVEQPLIVVPAVVPTPAATSPIGEGSIPGEKLPFGKGAIQVLRSLAMRAFHGIGFGLVTVLDAVDKPVARISYDIRYLCGWAAVVTLVMAGIVITMNGGW